MYRYMNLYAYQKVNPDVWDKFIFIIYFINTWIHVSYVCVHNLNKKLIIHQGIHLLNLYLYLITCIWVSKFQLQNLLCTSPTRAHDTYTWHWHVLVSMSCTYYIHHTSHTYMYVMYVWCMYVCMCTYMTYTVHFYIHTYK